MTTQAVRLFRRMDGLFAVYKPQGVHWKLVRDTIESNLLKGRIYFTCTVHKCVQTILQDVNNTGPEALPVSVF